ncbi:MAG: hypothetical protein JWM78_3499 [Verrucomicrobiaceae bacterium]|nr:hypothetical protein [Verrucomicrobiaceae bacterium]
MSNYSAAALAYKNGELSEAETRYRQLVNMHPDYAEGWFKLGNIYVRTGQYDAAENMYKQAAQLNPEDAKIWNNLALANIKKAVAVLDEGAQHVQQGSADQKNMLLLRDRIVQNVVAEK